MSWLDQPMMVGLVSVVVTGIGIITKYSERRIFASFQTIALSVAIVLVAAGAAFAIALLPAGRVGVLGIGAAFPFWTDAPGSGGALKRSSSHAATFTAQLIALVWAITGFLSSSLDRCLTRHKIEAVQRLSDELRQTYTGRKFLSQALEDALTDYLNDLSNARDKRTMLARLRAAHIESAKHGLSEVPLLRLVYDWKIEYIARYVVVRPPTVAGRTV